MKKTIFVCDRCGFDSSTVVGDGPAAAAVRYSEEVRFEGYMYDLCSKCAGDMRLWLSKKQPGE